MRGGNLSHGGELGEQIGVVHKNLCFFRKSRYHSPVYLAPFFVLLAVTACASSQPTTRTPTRAPVSTPTATPTASAPSPTRGGDGAPALFHRQSDIANLALDSTHVYWATCQQPTGSDTIARSAKPGGAPALIVSEQNCPAKLTPDAANLYWASGNKILRAALGGGPVTTVVSGDDALAGFALDPSDIYYALCDANAGGALFQLAKAGGTPKPLAKEPRCARIEFADGAHIYFTTYDRVAGDELQRVPKSGGASEKIATLARYPVTLGALSADDRAVYWAQRQDPGKPQGDADDYNSILALDMQTKATRTIATQQPRPAALALDATHVYWSNCGTLRYNFENAALMRANKTLVPAVPLVPSVCATQIAVDATHAYWVSKDGIGRIGK